MSMFHNPDRKLQVLKRVPLFAGASRRQLVSIATMMDEIVVAPGSVLVRQGRQGHSFYIVVEGRAEAVSEGVSMAEFSSGDFFGEISMIDRGPATATVTALTETTLMVLSHDQFRRLLQSDPALEVAVTRARRERLARNQLEGVASR
jgi:CRP-like cAMP-binding protein